MASNTKTVLALLLIVCIVENELSPVGSARPPSALPTTRTPPTQGGAGATCSAVIGIKKRDICWDIATKNKLTLEELYGINPNVNCDNLFIGQWICIKGTPGK